MKRTIILALAAASLALAQPAEPRQIAIAAGAGGGFMQMNPGCDLGRGSPIRSRRKGRLGRTTGTRRQDGARGTEYRRPASDC
jgi:hypothetical protein